MLFDAREPEPLERIELQLAGIASAFAGALGTKKIGPEKFLVRPQWPSTKPKRTAKEIRDQWLGWARAHNAGRRKHG